MPARDGERAGWTVRVRAPGRGRVADQDDFTVFRHGAWEGWRGVIWVLETPWAKLEMGISRDLVEQTAV